MRRYAAWVLMAMQMIAWAWMMQRGGQLGDREYLVFCAGMMLGQIGAGVECLATKAWGTFVVQAYFFCFTAYGAFVRYAGMH